MTTSKTVNYLLRSGTGGSEPLLEEVTVVWERFEVTLQLDQAGRFAGISRVAVTADFVDAGKEARRLGYHDLDDLYPPEGNDD